MSNKITRFRGDTYSVDAVISKNGTPIDFTDGTTAIFTFEKGAVKESIVGLNPTVNGDISFPFPAVIKAGKYKYDIQKQSCSTDYGILNYGVRIRFYSSNAASLFKLRWT